VTRDEKTADRLSAAHRRRPHRRRRTPKWMTPDHDRMRVNKTGVRGDDLMTIEALWLPLDELAARFQARTMQGCLQRPGRSLGSA
jgi:hypothetical protein